MQGSRFEQKYIISEEKALEVRAFGGSRFQLDEHGAGKPNYSYAVHGLYLDSTDLKLYWGTINGEKSRYKLRLRFYEENADAPVYFEIKHRTDTRCRIKKRAAVRRDAVERLLAGHTPWRPDLVSNDPEQFAALQEFCERMRELQAGLTVHVGYLREAYSSRDDTSARLTMDREVRAEPESAPRLFPTMENPILVWGKEVMLEMKFIDQFPDSFRDLVNAFGLRQCGAAKYVDSVATLGEHKVRGPRGD
jgi:hypothetical protein